MKFWKSLTISLAIAACALPYAAKDIATVNAAANDTETVISEAAFPNEVLRTLAKQADTDGNGALSKAEIQKVTKMDIVYPHKETHPWYGASLSDLYDYDMKHDYDGVPVDLTGLDIFQNLERLRIHNAKPLNIPFEKLKKLSFFEISTVPEMELDVSGAPGLKELAAAEAVFTDIHLEKNTALEHLKLYHVSVPDSTLDLAALSSLKSVTADGCGLTQIDLSACTGLERAELGGNSLSSLDVAHNKKLKYLYLQDSGLKKLDLRQNACLETLNIDGNAFQKINSSTLRVAKDSVLSWISAGNLSRSTLLDVSHISSLKELHAPSGAFTKVKIGKALAVLDISSSGLKTLDAKTLQAPSKAGLAQLHCSSGRLKKLNAGHLKNLKSVIAGSNRLTEVNLSGCRKLESCYLNGNPLKKLIVDKSSNRVQKKQYKKIVKENGGKLIYQ